jgi:hypothetical protein
LSSKGSLFRINLAEYFLIEEKGLYKRITLRPKILYDNSALVILSKLDQKVYDFIGINASEEKQETSKKLAEQLGARHGFAVEQIVYPNDDIAPEHLQFIEFFVDDLYLPTTQIDISEHYRCYFCGEAITRNSDSCHSCKKEVMECFVCDCPILSGDKVGKCSLCGAVAHYIHFKEWIKALGMCSKCNEKLNPDQIIPLTDENKDSFFK